MFRILQGMGGAARGVAANGLLRLPRTAAGRDHSAVRGGGRGIRPIRRRESRQREARQVRRRDRRPSRHGPIRQSRRRPIRRHSRRHRRGMSRRQRRRPLPRSRCCSRYNKSNHTKTGRLSKRRRQDNSHTHNPRCHSRNRHSHCRNRRPRRHSLRPRRRPCRHS